MIVCKILVVTSLIVFPTESFNFYGNGKRDRGRDASDVNAPVTNNLRRAGDETINVHKRAPNLEDNLQDVIAHKQAHFNEIYSGTVSLKKEELYTYKYKISHDKVG